MNSLSKFFCLPFSSNVPFLQINRGPTKPTTEDHDFRFILPVKLHSSGCTKELLNLTVVNENKGCFLLQNGQLQYG